MYYLQSRYYDPELGRFLNADALISTGQGLLDNNMFAYCNNNPANYWDPTGTCKNNFSIYFKVDCGDWLCPTSSALSPFERESQNDYKWQRIRVQKSLAQKSRPLTSTESEINGPSLLLVADVFSAISIATDVTSNVLGYTAAVLAIVGVTAELALIIGIAAAGVSLISSVTGAAAEVIYWIEEHS